jgi:predicted  nucleic acid-binding Zn-ribbon protein
MLRRAIVWGIAGTAVGILIFGKHLHSYVGTAAGWVQDSVKQAVPMEFEIDRARHMVKDIMPEIRKNMQIIAKEEVEVDRLGHDIDQLNKKQEKDRTDLTSLRDDLTGGGSAFRFAGRTYSVDQVKSDLANRLERFKTSDATLASLRQMQEARQKSLDAAREKLDQMLAQKRQLEVDVENLEARLKMVEVAQTSSSYNFDDSHLGNLKELIGDLRTRLSVEEKMVSVEGKLQDEIPVDQPAGATDNIVERVTEYLGGPTTIATEGPKVAEVSVSK